MASPGVGSISIRVFEGAVYEDATLVRLSPREAEYLMLAAARYGGLSAPAPPEGAQARVLVNRIRKRFKSEVLVGTGNGRYVLAPRVSVDIVQMVLGGAGHDDPALRLAIRRFSANPYRSDPWFETLEPQLVELARSYLELS